MLISAENISFGFSGGSLLENVSFTLSEGDRVGLIGPNGEGKTTLIRLIISELEPEGGEIFRKNGIRIGYLAQNGGYDSERSVYEEMKEIFAEDFRAIDSLRRLEKEIADTPENTPQYAVLAGRYETTERRIAARDGYNCEIRLRTVLNGMGFSQVYDQKISTMSGGEKTRLKLCRLLLEEPELLILDEPTNHLDIKTLFWLEEYLASFKGAILTVSHDRYFLDKTVREIYELENRNLSVFKGNYTKYKTLKAEKTARLLKEYEKQQEEIARLQDYVDRNIVRATTAKSALSRVKKLDRIEPIEKPKLPPSPPRFCFSYAEKPYEKVLEVNTLHLSAGGKTLLENASFTLRRGEKCALVGDNGTGKSTLLHEILNGKNPAIKIGRNVRIAFYDQENANLNPENTVLAELWERHVAWDQTKVRSVLAQAKLDAGDTDKKVRMLSGGERAKLALAVFECENGNALILDEPTNHLDLPARESLEDALKNFDGTVLFVSHDRYFIQALAGKIIELANGKITEFPGGYEEYNAFKNAAKENEAEKKDVQNASQLPSVPIVKVKEGGYRSREERAAETKKRLRVKEIEEQIVRCEEEEAEINAALALPEVAADFALLSEKCKRLEELHALCDRLYEEYDILS